MFTNERADTRFNRSEYLKAFRLPQDRIILEMDHKYIESVCDFNMDQEIHRMIGYAIEHKFLEFLGDNYIEGIKYKTDYKYIFGDITVDFELKTTSNYNFTVSETEWSDTHIILNPFYIFATTKDLGSNMYSIYINNVMLFSDICKLLIPSKFNGSKFISKHIVNSFK
jgi:hypothetical protein